MCKAENDNKHLLHQQRRAGVLLHPTSLPGPLPHGLICHDAYRFIEFLSHSGIKVWQMLPVGPTHADRSPYQSLSAHAGDPTLISLDWLKDKGLLNSTSGIHSFEQHQAALWSAWNSLQQKQQHTLYHEYQVFVEQHDTWLEDYALFMAIREQQECRIWMDWPKDLRDRKKSAIKAIKKELSSQVGFHKFTQYIFYQQWQGLKEYAAKHNVLLFGDLPIYVSQDSADVWVYRDLFLLDDSGQPTVVTGVPPDYFSDTGQRWGNPQYNWKAMQKTDFSWWVERLHTQLELFDLVRVDHFRGFEAYWEISAAQQTAIEGQWVKAPGQALLKTLFKKLHQLPLVAEDLGVITDEVTALREQFALPGMKILQFAFDDNPGNEYLPHNHEFNSVIYTGTHDNDTSLSWFEKISPEQQQRIYDYLGANYQELMPWPLIRAAMASVSCLAVLPMQDILGLGQGQRMNTPGTIEGNWQWRFHWSQVAEDLPGRLMYWCTIYDR